MSTTDEILKKVKKEYGESVAKKGSEGHHEVTRIPTGVFAFDLASGGGFPMGRVSLVYGAESSNKTNICLKAIANIQKLQPHKKAVFIDVEGSYDPAWASLLGVDSDALILITPEYAEQAVDLTEAFLYAEDVSLVVLDSLAALTTQNEIESSAEKASVGGSSLVIGKLIRKATVSINKMRNQGLEPPAFIGINQIRLKIGVMFGDPETMPGGNALKYASSFTVRMYGKNEMDKKIHPVLPAYKKTTFGFKKWKMPILSQAGEFTMLMLEHGGNQPGHVNDWNTVATYLKELDYLVKGKNGWEFGGKTYKTLDEIKAELYSDPILLNQAKQSIIKEMLDRGAGLSEVGDEESAADTSL